MKISIDVRQAVVASCRAHRLRQLAGVSLAQTWGTGAPETGVFEGGRRRVTAPSMGGFQGTGVSTGRSRGNAQQNQRVLLSELTTLTALSIDNPAYRTNKHAVVADSPGVRSWSPPV